MKATGLTRIAGRLQRSAATLTVGLLTVCPVAIESTIQGDHVASATAIGQTSTQAVAAESHDKDVETLVLVRHGEKPEEGLGLLTCKGLNRALLLPGFFAANFQRPDHIFAPNPAVKVTEIHGDGRRYDYVRPLLTIGPTAIQFGVPINTQLPFNDPGLLADTLLDPQYHKDTIYVVWEHSNLVAFAEIVLKRFHNPASVPEWSNSDYDTVYVFRFDWGKVPAATFEIRSENLQPTSQSCPQASQS